MRRMLVEDDRKLGELLAQKFDSQFSAGCRSLDPEVREEFRKLLDLRTGRVRGGCRDAHTRTHTHAHNYDVIHKSCVIP